MIGKRCWIIFWMDDSVNPPARWHPDGPYTAVAKVVSRKKLFYLLKYINASGSGMHLCDIRYDTEQYPDRVFKSKVAAERACRRLNGKMD